MEEMYSYETIKVLAEVGLKVNQLAKEGEELSEEAENDMKELVVQYLENDPDLVRLIEHLQADYGEEIF